MADPVKIWTRMASGEVSDTLADELIESAGIGKFITDTSEKTVLRDAMKLCATTGNCESMYEELARFLSVHVATPTALHAGATLDAAFPQKIVAIYLMLQRLLPATSPQKLVGFDLGPKTLPEMEKWVDGWWNGTTVTPWTPTNTQIDPMVWKTALVGDTSAVAASDSDAVAHVEPKADKTAVIHVEPKADETAVHVEPKADETAVHVEPKADADAVIHVEPKADETAVHVEPDAIAAVAHVEPKADADAVHVESHTKPVVTGGNRKKTPKSLRKSARQSKKRIM
jgi:hypothetical protein